MKSGDISTEEQCQMIAEASGWRDRALKAEASLATFSDQERAPGVDEALRGALDGIMTIANETLHSPHNPADSRERWYADGIREMRNSARAALAAKPIADVD